MVSDEKTFFCQKIQIEKDAVNTLILGQRLDLKSPPKLKLSQYWWDI